jgi:hypothetical protein
LPRSFLLRLDFVLIAEFGRVAKCYDSSSTGDVSQQRQTSLTCLVFPRNMGPPSSSLYAGMRDLLPFKKRIAEEQVCTHMGLAVGRQNSNLLLEENSGSQRQKWGNDIYL